MHKKPFHTQFKLPFTALLSGLIVTSAMLGVTIYDEINRQNTLFHEQTSELRESISQRINTADEIINSLATMYISATQVDGDQFRIFVENTLMRHNFVSSIIYLPKVNQDQRTEYEESLQDFGFINFTIKEKKTSNQYGEASEQSEYYPIQYYEPLTPLATILLGYNIQSEKNYKTAIDFAIESNYAIATFPFENTRNPGSYVILKALYSGKQVPTENNSRVQAANGLIAMHISMKDILSYSSAGQSIDAKLNLLPVFDNGEPAIYTLLDSNTRSKDNLGQSNIRTFRNTLDIRLPGQAFSLEANKILNWNNLGYKSSFFAFFSGLLITTLFVFISSRSQTRAKEKQFRNNEARLKKWNTALTGMAKSKVIANGEFKAAIREIIEAAAININVARCSVWLFTQDRNYLKCVDLLEKTDPTLTTFANEHRVSIKRLPVYFYALEEGRIIAIDNILQDPTAREFIEKYFLPKGITSVLYSPLRIGGEVTGALCLEHIGPARHWMPEEQSFAASMADMAVLAIQSSERRKAEEALREARDKALEATKAKSSFLANMSHELRTPLTAIVGFCNILNSKTLDAETIKRHTITIHKNAQHLLYLINDILDFSKIEANRLEINKENISLFTCIGDINCLLAAAVEQKSLAFNIDYEFPLPKNIFTDEIRLKQIIINLCSNAIKFTAQGSISLTIRYIEKNNQVEFLVKDTGIGLTSEQISNLFEAFTQADSSITKKYGGTGLGLSISRHLVKKLGGEINVNSVFGTGSCFSFTINPGEKNQLEFFNTRPANHVENTSAFVPDEISVRGSILLVEDTIDNQVLIRSYLEDMGASVDIANNGQLALQCTAQKKYDLVLMDMQMPIMGGIETVERLRKKLYKSPIVMLTGNAFEEDRQRSIQAGANGFLLKPIDLPALASVVSQYLQASNVQTRKDFSPPQQGNNLPIAEGIIISSLLGKSEKYDLLVKKFVDQLPTFINDMESAVNSGEITRIKAEIHRLKGVAGNYGFPAVTRLCKETEIMNQDMNLQSAKEYLNKLKFTIEKITKGNAQYFAQYNPPSAEKNTQSH